MVKKNQDKLFCQCNRFKVVVAIHIPKPRRYRVSGPCTPVRGHPSPLQDYIEPLESISNIQYPKLATAEEKKGPCSIKLSWANPWVPLIFEREPGAPNERTVLDASIPCFVEHMHRAQRTPNRPGVVRRATSSQRYLSQKPRNIRHSMFLTVLSHDFFPSRTFRSVKTKRYHQPFVFVFLPHPNSHHSSELWNHAIHCYPLLDPHSILKMPPLWF